jgi:hypothetical protein
VLYAIDTGVVVKWFIENLLCGNLSVQGEEEYRLLRQQQQGCLACALHLFYT